jgi:hypothetical protein
MDDMRCLYSLILSVSSSFMLAQISLMSAILSPATISSVCIFKFVFFKLWRFPFLRRRPFHPGLNVAPVDNIAQRSDILYQFNRCYSYLIGTKSLSWTLNGYILTSFLYFKDSGTIICGFCWVVSQPLTHLLTLHSLLCCRQLGQNFGASCECVSVCVGVCGCAWL